MSFRLALRSLLYCARGRRLPCKRRRTRPTRSDCLWRATLSWECEICGERFLEHRWAFDPRAGALSWIAGGNCAGD